MTEITYYKSTEMSAIMTHTVNFLNTLDSCRCREHNKDLVVFLSKRGVEVPGIHIYIYIIMMTIHIFYGKCGWPFPVLVNSYEFPEGSSANISDRTLHINPPNISIQGSSDRHHKLPRVDRSTN